MDVGEKNVRAAFPIMKSWILLSTSICLVDRGGLHRGICRLPTIHTLCHFHWMCLNSKSVLLVTWHLLHLSILERDPPLLLSRRFLPIFICNLWKWATQINWIEWTPVCWFWCNSLWGAFCVPLDGISICVPRVLQRPRWHTHLLKMLYK